MKNNIHPKYFSNAKVRCACGNEWITGATVPELEIEICSNCHPFYSGKEKTVDTRGRIEKFKRRVEKQQEKAKPMKKPRKKKQKK